MKPGESCRFHQVGGFSSTHPQSACVGSMRTLVLGMGSPIVTDDSIGLRVAERLRERLHDRADVEVVCTSQAGLTLLDLMLGFERVIIIDAIQTHGGQPGTVYRLFPEDFDQARHATTLHGVGLLGALDLGRTLEFTMPREVVLFAVEAEDVVTFSEKCTPAVKQCLPIVERLVLEELGLEGGGFGTERS